MIQSLRNLLHRRTHKGFTLIELAIVLGVAGLLFAGLYRLLSGGNQTLKDQAAASSQNQLINAVKGYLASTAGQNLLMTLGPNAKWPISLPGTAPDGAGNNACKTSAPYNTGTQYTETSPSPNTATPGICDFLPIGFTSANTNSYGQTFTIAVRKDNAAAGTAPSTYSFMIMTAGGNIIPDSSGGRLASAIGGDGGFIYSNNVCGAPSNTYACGAFGSWSSLVSNYFAAAPANGGEVATLTFVSPETNSNLPWLARNGQLGNPAYNTISGGINTYFAPTSSGGADNSLYFNTVPVGTTGIGKGFISMGGGKIDMGGGAITTPASIAMNTGGGPISNVTTLGVSQTISSPSTITMANGGTINVSGGSVNLGGGTVTGTSGSSINLVSGGSNPQINISSGCVQTSPGTPATCPYSLQVTGDANVSNLLNVNALYANTFIYQSSDMRLKTNIQPMTNSLDEIMKMRPVSYTLKSNGKDSMGVIAQEMEKIYPQLVSEGGGMKAVNYEGLIAPLIGAVQQLKKENDDLRDRVHASELHEKALEQKIKTLESP